MLAITPGEPAGVGPDLIILLARQNPQLFGRFRAVVIADAALLQSRARQLGTTIDWPPWRAAADAPISILPTPLRARATPGRLDPANSAYVLDALEAGVRGCLEGRFDALVTGPVHKGVINDAGIAFTGHTEFLAERTGTEQVVMMLTSGTLRVALATTHLPLKEVSAHLTRRGLARSLRILHADLVQRFGIAKPVIIACGLNPHAGEAGHLGREEIEIIEPALEDARKAGIDVRGPVPADTAFIPDRLKGADAVLAMYHDQGLPVLKHLGFGQAVNITLGLPFVRTSVDHGTALDLAGSGRVDTGSLEAAITTALTLIRDRRPTA